MLTVTRLTMTELLSARLTATNHYDKFPIPNSKFQKRSPYLYSMKYLLSLCLFLSLCALPLSDVGAQNIGGIGAQLLLDTTGGYTMPRIMALVPGTPADSVLKATDFIWKVNDISCKDKTIEDVVGMIRGEVGTTLKITVTDTKDGKKPRTYTLTRKAVQGVTNAPPPDPEAAFNQWCEQQVTALQGQRHTIIKTFNATCGNRYFNFEAERKMYHIMVITIEEKTAGVPFTTTVRVFDNENEAGAKTLTAPATFTPIGNRGIAKTEGEMTFTKDGIGVVNVKVEGKLEACGGIFVVVYR
jgi:hypothetical protein